MAAKVDSSVIKRTADTLGKVIAKPPLTEKLLSRPPFKYLHDIIIQVDKSSGIFKGLYSSQERDSKNIQEKDAKINFLQKAMNTISFTTGELVAVRPSKVVAGHEADKTNEFLQLMAAAVLKKLDSSVAVKRVLKGEDPSKVLAKGDTKKSQSKEKPSEEKKRSKSKERPSEDKTERPSEDRKRSKSKERPSEDKTEKPSEDKKQDKTESKEGLSVDNIRSRSKERLSEDKKRSQSKESPGEDRKRSGSDASKTKSKDSVKGDSAVKESGSSQLKSKSHHKITREESEQSSRPVHRPSRRRPSASTVGSELPEDPNAGGESSSEGVEDEGLGSETRVDRPSSARGIRRRGSRPPLEPEEESVSQTIQSAQGEGGTRTSANQSPSPPVAPVLVAPPMRPSSARPAPPKVVQSGKDEELKVSAPPPSHLGDVPSTVILETPGGAVDDDDDDDDQFVVADSTPLVQFTEQALITKPNEGLMDEKPEGALTKNIVAMKERLEGDLSREPSGEEKGLIPALSEAHRRKEREMVSKEIERLQTSIQTLCRSANPLGKIMDYVQEDIDSMQKELEMWQLENRKHSEALHKEQSITELELQPLRAQLEELEAKIVEQVDMISATKATILKNDVKTQQMLNSMAFASS